MLNRTLSVGVACRQDPYCSQTLRAVTHIDKRRLEIHHRLKWMGLRQCGMFYSGKSSKETRVSAVPRVASFLPSTSKNKLPDQLTGEMKIFWMSFFIQTFKETKEPHLNENNISKPTCLTLTASFAAGIQIWWAKGASAYQHLNFCRFTSVRHMCLKAEACSFSSLLQYQSYQLLCHKIC